MKRTLQFIACIALSPLLATTSFAQDPPAPPEPPSVEDVVERRIGAMTEKLSLSPEQAEMFTEILTNSLSQERVFMEQIREIKEGTKEVLESQLTAEQKALIEENPRLQRLFIAGPPHRPGAGRGGPKGERGPGNHRGFMQRVAEKIGVTEEQRAEIKEQMVADDANLREVLQNVLTEEQLAQLAELKANRRAGDGIRKARGPHGRRGGGRGDAHGPRGHRMGRILDEVGVTEEQHAQIKEQMAADDANPREVLQNVLTEEQLEQLAELKANRRAGDDPESDSVGASAVDQGRGRRPAGPRMGRILDEVGVTEEQHAQIKEQMAADDANPREVLQNVLTEEQLEDLAELRANRNPEGRGPRGEGKGRGERLRMHAPDEDQPSDDPDSTPPRRGGRRGGRGPGR